MRLKHALLALCLLLPAAAMGQTPGTFVTDRPIATTGLVNNINTILGTKADATNPVVTGTLTLGGVSASGFGFGLNQALTPLLSRGGNPSVEINGRLIFNNSAPTINDFATLHIRRDGTTVTGGTASNLPRALVVDTSVGAADGSQTWGMLTMLHSNSTVGALGVAGYSQAVRNAGSNAWMWGFISEMTDQTGLNSAAVGNPSLSQEVDLTTTGVDDFTNPAKIGGLGGRHFIHFVASRYTGSANNEVTHGLWFGTSHTYIDSLIGFDTGGAGGAQVRSVLDTRGAIPPTGSSNPVAAVTMTAGHVIDFAGGAALNSAPQRYLTFDGGSGKLEYFVGGGLVFSVDGSGNARFAGTVTASTTP